MKTVLTIAGSDSSGGAGIQADIKTMTAHGVYAMSAVTALTAQNTVAVTDILEVPPAFLAAQLDSVFLDIPPDAVKIGMVATPEQASVIAKKLVCYHAERIVIDPVMVSSTEWGLTSERAVKVMEEELYPLATLLTPNLREAGVLSGREIQTREEMEWAARAIGERFGTAVLCKGGHLTGGADDYLWQPSGGCWLCGERVQNPNTHGTGCTLSSAIASNLAGGFSLLASVERAKGYLSRALGAMLDLGAGSGPLNHLFDLKPYEPHREPESERGSIS